MTRTWSASENTKLIELFYDNKTVREMAAYFNCGKMQVYGRCGNNGLYFRDRKKLSEDYSKPVAEDINECERKCLKCREAFLSNGPGNRICGPCSHSNYGYAGVVYG